MNKRLFDMVFATLGLILVSPLILLIMLLILVGDGKNPFFVQKRMGLKGRPFPLLKFRTMTPGDPSSKDSFEAGQTSRVTRFGKFLRKTKLDEIPQLLNVIKGDMSLVGPRPEVEKWTKVYPEKWEIVHRVKPGITDNASIIFRNEEELLARSPDPETFYKNDILPRKLNLYTEYVYTRSFKQDIKIIYRTITSVWIS